tara:strand:+ start:14161 stop:16692 length:2532 start_codon:yes stop_codon:yes gene_type:complete
VIKIRLLPLVAAACLCSASVYSNPEAFEVGPDNLSALPGGKEADGLLGDFILRNNRVEAVISANKHLRRPNMSTFYGAGGTTPGNLYDLTLRGANNDQMVIFTPSGQQGPVSYVRIVKDGSDGEAVIETVVSAPMNKGLYKRHEYRLRDDWSGLLIVTTWRNEGNKAAKGSVADRWTRFDRVGKLAGITYVDAIDPAHKCGYAYGWYGRDGFEVPKSSVTVEPGQEVRFARFIAVGTSPADAYGKVAAFQGIKSARIKAKIQDPADKGISTAKAEFKQGGATLTAYPDDNGEFSIQLPLGTYKWTASDIGRGRTKEATLQLNRSDVATPLNGRLDSASVAAFDIRDQSGKSLPCKAQFHGINGTKNPNLGPDWRAHGSRDQYHSERGKFSVQLDPGEYEIIVTRGIEYSHLRKKIKLGAGETVKIAGALKRLVDTAGWVSADYHNHSTPSGDNVCGTDDRVINLAAEHIEFAPTTEHNRIYDWTPHIKKLGLEKEIYTVPGMELTGSGAHFNTFPLKPEPTKQDGGAPVHERDPRLNAVNLKNWQDGDPARWIQINHPDMVFNFTDRNADGRPDGGFLGLPELIDGIETENYAASAILSGVPYRVSLYRGQERVYTIRQFMWLQLLNQGFPVVGVAVCDAHRIYGNGVGGWRMYAPSKSDNPWEIDWRENSRHAKEGRTILTTGPFLQVETGDGTLPGGTTRAHGSIDLKIHVQCTDWIDIDRVQILVNGRQLKSLNFTRKSHKSWFGDGVVKFDRKVNIPLSEDSHLIVVAIGENFDLKTGYGTSRQSGNQPVAYHNPIFVDLDGAGFKPNGDTLGFPIPVARISPKEAKRLLDAHKTLNEK